MKDNLLIITYDIETVSINDIYYPFAVGIYWENNYKVFYWEETINDYYLNSCNIINFSIDYLFSLNNINNYIIYIHNLGKFDSLLITRFLKYNFKIYIHNNICYKLSIYKNKKLSITFQDSLKILNMSLLDACKAFKIIDSKKDIDYKLFTLDNIFKECFKIKLIDYLKYDCISLYQIMCFFTNKIYNEYGILPKNYLSIASLSFKIWRCYCDIIIESNIKSNKWKDEFVRQAYHGGRCEIFKPFLENGYYYDVNSLYPFIMQSFMFPIGTGEFVKCNYSFDINEFFGFIYCEIFSPYNYIPILPFNNNGNLIYPTGKWMGVYFSEEIKLAIKYGYKIKPIKGLKYQKGNIFKEFIDEMYNKRLSSTTKQENTFYKLIMNSLSGKFAMKQSNIKYNIININDLKRYDNIIDIININDKNDLVFIKLENDNNMIFNSHVQISAAITSYARCYMYNIIKINNIDIYYMDTDSIISQNMLPKSLVSNQELGKFKLEYQIKKAVFISIKVYMIITTDNKEIIKFKSLKSNYTSNISFENMYNMLYKYNINKIEILNYFKIIKNWQLLQISYNNMNIKFEMKYKKRKKKYFLYKWYDTEATHIDNLGT